MREVYKNGVVIIPSGVSPWPHEIRVARFLAGAGGVVEFLAPMRGLKIADVLVDGVEYEMKSPFTNKADKLERVIKRALKQSKNIIFDSSRIKNMRDDRLRCFLVDKIKTQPQIGKIIFVTKQGKIIDVNALI